MAKIFENNIIEIHSARADGDEAKAAKQACIISHGAWMQDSGMTKVPIRESKKGDAGTTNVLAIFYSNHGEFGITSIVNKLLTVEQKPGMKILDPGKSLLAFALPDGKMEQRECTQKACIYNSNGPLWNYQLSLNDKAAGMVKTYPKARNCELMDLIVVKSDCSLNDIFKLHKDKKIKQYKVYHCTFCRVVESKAFDGWMDKGEYEAEVLKAMAKL